MRLSDSHRKTIRRTVVELFGKDARVLLFGSRTVNDERGGDIDLLVDVPHTVTDGNKLALTLTARLQLLLGDQPIDVLVLDPGTRRQPVHDEALRTGIPL